MTIETFTCMPYGPRLRVATHVIVILEDSFDGVHPTNIVMRKSASTYAGPAIEYLT